MSNKTYIFLEKSEVKNKRFTMFFYEPIDPETIKKIKMTSFGSINHSNYILHKDDKRKKNYLERHAKRENWEKYWTPGSLSRYILWNKDTLYKSMVDYAKRFNLKMLQNITDISDIERDMKRQYV